MQMVVEKHHKDAGTGLINVKAVYVFLGLPFRYLC